MACSLAPVVPYAEIVPGEDEEVREHQGVAGPAELVTPDRLAIFRDRVRNADLIRDKPRLIHPTRDGIPLDLEDRNPERVEDVRARDVQDDGPAPASAHRGRARPIHDRDAKFADGFTGVRIDEPPAPLKADDIDVEGVRVVRGGLQIGVEGERVQGEAEEKSHQQRGQDRREGRISEIGHDAEPWRVRGFRRTRLPPIPREEEEEHDEDGPADDHRGDDVQCEEGLPLLRRGGQSWHETRLSILAVKAFTSHARTRTNLSESLSWENRCPARWVRDGEWTVIRHGPDGRAEKGRS